jgi:DNA polymerase-3 subunit epsilon
MRGFDGRLLVFDTETTGVEVERDRIVELGAAYFEARAYVEHRRNLIDPGVPIPEGASAVHGITDARVAGKPSFAVVAPRFVAHLDGSERDDGPPVLCGYNALAFDVPLVNAELARVGLAYRIDPAMVVDPVIFVRWHLRALRSRALEPVCAHLGVSLEKAHSAAADARATGELLFRMIDAGHVPDDLDEALSEQAELAERLALEWERFGYWLYRDRSDGFLRLGAGRYCGEPLDSIDAGYLDFLLHKIDDLPAGAREELERRLVPA